jgi:hypothetical protein
MKGGLTMQHHVFIFLVTLPGLLQGRAFDPKRPRPRSYSDATWAFQLKELPGRRTRLVVSGYWAMQPRWVRPVVSFIFLEPAHWIMQLRQFQNLKRRAERDSMRAEQRAA